MYEQIARINFTAESNCHKIEGLTNLRIIEPVFSYLFFFIPKEPYLYNT